MYNTPYSYDPNSYLPSQQPPQKSNEGNYIGLRVDIITNSDSRYEGTVSSIDSQNQTMTLANVKCFGTEDRRDPEEFCAPSDEIKEQLEFLSVEIKSVEIIPVKPTVVQQPVYPPQPMMMHGQQAYYPQGMDPNISYMDQNMYAQQQYMNYNMAPNMYAAQQQYMNQMAPQQAYLNPQTYPDMMNPHYVDPAYQQYGMQQQIYPNPMQLQYQSPSSPQQPQQQQLQPIKSSALKIVPKQDTAKKTTEVKQETQQTSTTNTTNNINDEQFSNEIVEAGDDGFDFAEANSRFEKAENTDTNNTDITPKVEVKFDNKKSFFDDLGSDRSNNKRNRNYRNRSQDIDTFGESAQSQNTQQRYRGQRRGGNRKNNYDNNSAFSNNAKSNNNNNNNTRVNNQGFNTSAKRGGKKNSNYNHNNNNNNNAKQSKYDDSSDLWR